MHPPLRIAASLHAALTSIGTIVLLTGCGSQPAPMDYYARTEYQIIDRAPNMIRPADDVIVLGDKLGYGVGSTTYNGNNLWDRLRDRMGLEIADNPRVDKVNTGKQMDLARAAKLTGVRLSDLRLLNAGLKRGKTQPTGPHRLLVPVGYGRKLHTATSRSQPRLPPAPQDGNRHRVRAEDTLTQVSKRHQISIARLRKENGLKRDHLLEGKVLIIPQRVPVSDRENAV